MRRLYQKQVDLYDNSRMDLLAPSNGRAQLKQAIKLRGKSLEQAMHKS